VEWITALARIYRPMGWAGVEQSVSRPRRVAMVASTTAWHYAARVTRSFATPLIQRDRAVVAIGVQGERF
jgi:hypothetical protein